MKIFLLCVCVMGVTNAAVLQQQRHIRDVSELLSSNYLPPEEDAATTAPLGVSQLAEIGVPADDVAPAAEQQDEPALGANGYEYRVVRKLRYRHRQRRRDVSHLNLGYLPPPAQVKAQPQPQPLNAYLPPATLPAAPRTPAPLNNEYLPPVAAAPLQQQEPLQTEAPATEVAATEAPATEAPATEAVPEETAIFADDGYHYKRPAVQPDLGFVPAPEPIVEEAAPEPETRAVEVEPEAAPEPEPEPESEPAPAPEPEAEPAPVPAPVEPLREYLPPLEKGAVVAEGPGDESAVLADDGYHYRAIKRVRFF